MRSPAATRTLMPHDQAQPITETGGGGALRAVVMAALIVAVGVGTKTHALWTADRAFDAGRWLQLVAVDVALGSAWLLAWGLILRGLRGTGLRVGALLHGGAGLLVVAATAAAHAFWLVTGSTLDFELLAYTSRNASMVAVVVASEVGVGSVVGIAVLIALPWVLRWMKGRRLAKLLGRIVGPAVVLAFIGVTMPAWPVGDELPGRLQPLRRQAALTIGNGTIAALLGGPDLTDVEVATAPVQAIVVRRTAATKRRNVLLVVLESARADALTTYNPARETMPFVDSLARRGVVVERSYTTIPHTTKSLVPIHCGIQPQIAAGYHEATPGAMPGDCMARVLRRFGYATAYFQASEPYFERRRDLIEQCGFEDYFGLDDIPADGFEVVNYFGLEDKALVQPALKWVDAHPDEPFLMAFMTLISHHPYTTPKSWKVRQWSKNKDENGYFNALRYTDEMIEALVDGLRERGRLKDTLVVVVGDHGEGFAEHGLRQHDAVLYEEVVRVPFVLHGAGIEPTGRRIGGLRGHVDIMPTVLDVLGLDVLAGTLDGSSVLSTPGRTELPISCWYQDRCIGVLRSEKTDKTGVERLFKTIWHYEQRGAEVFELTSDPGEQKNLLGTVGHTAADVAARVQRLKAWKASINARYSEQAQRRRNPWVHRENPGIGKPCNILFGDAIRLVSWELEPGPVKAGGAAWATYVFEVLKPPPANWRLFVHADGPVDALEKADHVPVEGSYPVAAWRPGDFVVDRNYVRFDLGLQSGKWRISLGFWDHKSGKRPTTSGDGLVVTANNKVVLGEVEIQNDDRPAPVQGRAGLPKSLQHLVTATLPPIPAGFTATEGGARFGTLAVHRRTNVTAGVATPGTTVTLEHVFEVTGAAERGTQLFVHAAGPGGRYINADHRAVGGKLLAVQWQTGEFVTDRHTIELPKDWPAGDTVIRLGFWNPELHTPHNRVPVLAQPGVDDEKGGVRVATVQVAVPATKAIPPPAPVTAQ